MAAHATEVSLTKKNWILDIVLFAAFLISTAPHFTGMAIHEWLGIALGAGIIMHLLLHWQWTVTVVKRFFKRLPANTRINSILNIVLFASMTLLIFSGLLISESALPLLGIQLSAGHSWEMIHRLASDFVLIVLAIHVGLHGKWLVSAFRTYLWQPLARLFTPRRTRSTVPTTQEAH